MSKKLYEESNIQEIASTIREKKGTQDTYKVSQMAEAMSDLIGPPAYNNMILAQDTQPDNEYNKVWFDTDADDEYIFPEIDDNNVSGNDTWSSEKINTENNTIKTDVNILKTDVNDLKEELDSEAHGIYKSVGPSETVSFNDAADDLPIKNLTVNMKPIQDFHGYDYPWPTGGGKNLLPISIDNDSKTFNGITLTVVRDSDDNILGINVNGTAKAPGMIAFTSFFTLKAGSYLLVQNEASSGSFPIVGAGSFKPWLPSTPSAVQPDKVFSEDTTGYIGIQVTAGGTFDNEFIQPMICYADETDLTFAPYSNVCAISGHDSVTINANSATSTIQLPETVYHGNVEIVSGSGESKMGIVDLGTLNWVASSSFGSSFSAAISTMKQNTASAICSKYKVVNTGSELTATDKAIYTKNNGATVYCKDSSYTDATAFKSAMSGVQLCYELATPVIFSTTPTEIIPIDGDNNVFSANGDVEVIYAVDLKPYIDDATVEIPELSEDVDDLKSRLNDYQNSLNLFDFIPGTTQTVNFDTLGKPASIVHTNGTDALRTDSFVWTDNTVTETRTLANGKHIVMATDLTTLVTTISEIQEGT